MSLRDTAYRLWRRTLPIVNPMAARLAPRAVRGTASAPAVSAYCILRSRNAQVVSDFVAALPAGSIAHLHLLDDGETGPAAGMVRSQGPGLRSPLLNGLLAAHPPREGDWVMIFDDDVRWTPGAGRALLAVAQRGGLEIAQPAHAPGSESTFYVTRFEALSLARLSTFVEVGPVVVFSPTAQEVALPFPEKAAMGWGVDVWWATLGLRLGIVDAAPMHHLGPVGAAYSDTDEMAFTKPHLDQLGVSSAHDLARALGATWRPWQSRPKWLRGSDSRR